MTRRSRRDLVLLEAANVLGGISNAVVMIVLPWLILERTGSAAAAGLVGALSALPGIVVSPVVGVLVDRFGRKTVSVTSDLFSGLSVLMFPLLDRVGWLGYGTIIGLAIMGAIFDPAGYTARKAMIPQVSIATGVGKEQVNGLHEGLFMGGWVVGPMAGALGIATVGSVQTMWFAFGAFVLAALAVQAMGVPNRAAFADGELTEASPWHSARAGLSALLRDRPVWVLTVVIAVIWLLYAPTESVLLPVHFQAIEQPKAFGIVISAMSVGGVVGAFGYGWLSRRTTKHRLAKTCMLMAGITYVPLALLPSPWVMVIPALLLGIAWGPMEPLLNSVVQDRFPESQHGRIYGVQLSLLYCAPPLGQLISGAAVEAFGVSTVFGWTAALFLAFVASVAAMPVLRGLNDVQPSRPVA